MSIPYFFFIFTMFNSSCANKPKYILGEPWYSRGDKAVDSVQEGCSSGHGQPCARPGQLFEEMNVCCAKCSSDSVVADKEKKVEL